MRNGLMRAFSGRRIWRKLKRKYCIDDQTIVIVLPEANEKWNDAAIRHLPDYIRRKNAGKAVVLTTDETLVDESLFDRIDTNLSVGNISLSNAYLLSDYYCLNRFYDKIQILFLDYPKDNRAGYVLNTTDVTEDELVCLAFYILREVPVHV